MIGKFVVIIITTLLLIGGLAESYEDDFLYQKGDLRGRIVFVRQNLSLLQPRELVLYIKGGELKEFRIKDEKIYRNLYKTESEFIEVYFEETEFGRLLGLPKVLIGFKEITREEAFNGINNN